MGRSKPTEEAEEEEGGDVGGGHGANGGEGSEAGYIGLVEGFRLKMLICRLKVMTYEVKPSCYKTQKTLFERKAIL